LGLSWGLELTDLDAARLVWVALAHLEEAQVATMRPILQDPEGVEEALRGFQLGARYLPQPAAEGYWMEFGWFQPPDAIWLDKRIPQVARHEWGEGVAETLATYTAAHELVHLDDWLGGDRLLQSTFTHILEAHQAELEAGLRFLEGEAWEGVEGLATLWAAQYVDLLAHYRAYYALRRLGLKGLDAVWSSLGDGYFPPSILTHLEHHKGADYIWSLLEREGCLVEVVDEIQRQGERLAHSYTV